MSSVIIIPSRIGATRLPRKPLADINGQEMIVHVLNRAKGIADVVVATDDEDIKKVVEKNGGIAVMTESSLPSGTDRTHAAINILDPKGTKYSTIVNLQGDLPNIESYVIKETIELLENLQKKSIKVDITTPVALIKNEQEINNINVVKPILALREGENYAKALYFTRKDAPFSDNGKNDSYYHHIGLYVYTRDVLEKFVTLPVSGLEKRERLEQLRALENDMTIYAKIVSDIPISVDTPEDLSKARLFINK